jgi:hypothetical protein
MTATYDPRADWAHADVEAARSPLETLVAIDHEGIYGDHTHLSVTERDDCEAHGEAVLDQQAADEVAAELAVERFYEDQGYWDARAQEDYEAARGIYA